MLKCGSFRLTKFWSISHRVLEALPPEEVSPSAILNIDIEKKERALGVSWDTVKDVFTFPTKLKEAPVTKRGILSTTNALFDPLGFLSPFILKAKILLQELWRLNYDWDQEIEEKMQNHWEKWIEGAKKVSKIALGRQYITDDRPISEVQLHIFCDASEMAYGCVAYIHFTFKSGNHFCHKWKSSVSFAVHSLLHLSSTVRFRLQSRRRRLASLSFAACGSSPSAWLFHLCRLRRLVRLRRMLPPVTRTFSALAACDTRTPPHPGGVPPLELYYLTCIGG